MRTIESTLTWKKTEESLSARQIRFERVDGSKKRETEEREPK